MLLQIGLMPEQSSSMVVAFPALFIMRREAKKSPEFRFKAITKTREDENFFRKRLEMPLLPADHVVAGEGSPEPLRPLRVEESELSLLNQAG